MAPRALWKGFLQFAAVSCPVALYTAASTSERVALHTINRETGHGVRREYVDSQTDDIVEKEDQVRGYEAEKDSYVVLEPEELASVAVKSDKTIAVSAFIPLAEIDQTFLDNPYYLAPADNAGNEIFGIICEGLKRTGAVAIGQAVLFRKLRNLLIRAHGAGLIATTLNFDYEVRSAADAFSDIADLKIKGEMLDLAKHIIETKMGAFDPAEYRDRYEAALVELIQAKMQGKTIAPAKRRAPAESADLMSALRESAGLRVSGRRGKSRARPASARPKPSKRASRRKTG